MVNFIILLKVFTQIQNVLLNKAKQELIFSITPKVYDRDSSSFNIYINELATLFDNTLCDNTLIHLYFQMEQNWAVFYMLMS
jgi:hypothetical protein